MSLLAGQIGLLFTIRIVLPLLIVPFLGGALVFWALKATQRTRPYFLCWKAYLAGSCYSYLALALLSFTLKSAPNAVISLLVLNAAVFFITQLVALAIILRDQTTRALLAQAVAVGLTNLVIFGIVFSIT